MFTFSEASEKQAEKILAKYPFKKSAMLPLLALAQKQEGYVTAESMEEIADRLDVSPAYVQSVCTFYTMFYTKPVGKYVIQFCINISCYLNDCDSLLDYTAEKLNVKIGETTEDKKFSLFREECLAACSAAPVMRINDTYYENLTPEKVDQILGSLK